MVNQSIEVIPGILEKDTNIIRQRIADVKPFVKWVQIDIADGKLVANTALPDPQQLQPLFIDPLQFELHMMVEHPLSNAARWIDAGFDRLIFHIEALEKEARQHEIATKLVMLQEKVEVAIAIDYQTPISAISNYLDIIDGVLVMTIKAGFSGQRFMPEMLEKVRKLRMLKPHLAIEVDGGINEKTAQEAITAGANRLVVTSYIFHSPSIEKAIWTLKNLNH